MTHANLRAEVALGFAWRRELGHGTVVTDMARSARARLRLLSDLASSVAATRTVAQVADVVLEHGLRAAGGDTCTLYALTPEADALELLAVALTAYASVEDARRALDAGFQRHITKPVEPLLLVRAIASLAQTPES